MEIRVEIVSDVLHLPEVLSKNAGCVVRFTGVVREEEDGRLIDGIEYEAYQPMAEKQMRRILEELSKNYPFQVATVVHRIGFVPAGEASIIVEVQARHRKEAFVAVEKFMNRLKQDIPIWKSSVRWRQ